MEPDPSKINPTLKDLFETTLNQAKGNAQRSAQPVIVIRGDHNIISWGGPVHLSHAKRASTDQRN